MMLRMGYTSQMNFIRPLSIDWNERELIVLSICYNDYGDGDGDDVIAQRILP
jgi:hypothetical protein